MRTLKPGGRIASCPLEQPTSVPLRAKIGLPSTILKRTPRPTAARKNSDWGDRLPR